MGVWATPAWLMTGDRSGFISVLVRSSSRSFGTDAQHRPASGPASAFFGTRQVFIEPWGSRRWGFLPPAAPSTGYDTYV